MFERYTERARRVLFFARYEASQLGSVSIETEHLLLGLLREGKGVTSRVFAEIRLSTEEVLRAIASRNPPGKRLSTSVEIPFSTETKRVLQFAAEEADRLLHNHIGTEHLLLGLLREERSHAAQILTGKGLELFAVRNDIVRLVSSGPAPDAAVWSRRAAAGITPSYDLHVSASDQRTQEGNFTSSGPDYWQATGFGLRAIIARVFRADESRIDLPADLDDNQRYDFALRTPSAQSWQGMERLVQQGLERHFHITIAREMRPMDVHVLTAPDGIAGSIQGNEDYAGGGFAAGFWEFTTAADAPPPNLQDMQRRITFGNMSASGTDISGLCRTLEEMVDHPVVDETNLTGRYDVAVKGEFRSIDEFFQAMKDQTGLHLSPGRREVAMLVVRPS